VLTKIFNFNFLYSFFCGLAEKSEINCVNYNLLIPIFAGKHEVRNKPVIPVSDYTYELPDEKIAIYPLTERDRSKLLVWKNGKISESVFSNLDNELSEGTLLVRNDTRVIHARLIFYRPSGARVEVFCLEPYHPSDYQISFQQKENTVWRCMVGNAKKWKESILERKIRTGEGEFTLKAEMTGRNEQGFLICFSWDSGDTFASVIEAAGEIPIPPYLNRQAEEDDNLRYQTLYAKVDGSVAAPTAGLHFTEKVLKLLTMKNISTAELTLHVGAGTFQPVKSEWIADHTMHTESVLITKDFLQKLLNHEGKVVAVGTTSVRSLESLYWLGLKTDRFTPEVIPHLDQWDPYLAGSSLSGATSISNLLKYMEQNNLNHLTFTTSLLIIPGYYFRMINGMITNFHQPQSTLLLLIAAFLGPGWREVYEYALSHNFRFLSYGDSNLYLKG
jgi:S-adenosylmethionine:tRNA ribosyltransferase-isomerase